MAKETVVNNELKNKKRKYETEKLKTKKRKHESPTNEDIVNNTNVKKHKHKDLNTELSTDIKKFSKKEHKSKKKSKDIVEESSAVSENEYNKTDDETYQPTVDELRESKKPENVKAILTVRQKKKQKHLERVKVHKEQSGDKEVRKNEEYLQKWKTSKAEWKFEKLRQISIQQTVFDENKITTHIWPIALEYLSGSKGAARETITKLAEEVIDKLDQECATEISQEEKQLILNSVKYQRARDLLQH
ncbi:uncharacterized protein C7orf50 homolog [Teleopsis dalmanni]|uniref:uncharacterized protein C7orf50 homolog n=1 Tax=Teleopsis dalmanni TaxID=139649 RepID=UPI0018CE0514|nr:uncharacterized protein C7orf50 homolog [Teleopsis dalmanni]